MENEYISYLNSLNNAHSANENALAEAQVTNPFYERIRVVRNIGLYLAEIIKEKPVFIILTGHAGDGKTSLVYQILRQFNLIKINEDLKVYDEIYSEELSKSIFYVKDMSELSENKRIELLKKCLDVKEKGNSSILVSNTGPLLNTFKKVYRSDEVEMRLLELMDKNEGNEAEVAGNKLLLVNMARIDNVILAPKLFSNLLTESLWAPCRECRNSQDCPIYKNYKSLSRNLENVNNVICAFYRWMFENDKRLTIRQILSHLSYTITGNLTCNDVKNRRNLNKLEFLFNYGSSNLFFGYIGMKINEDAKQIKAIRELQNLELDSKELEHDYSFFVKNDFSFLVEDVREIAEQVWKKCNRKYTFDSLNLLTDTEPYELRKAMRRMQILFGQFDKKSILRLYDSIFSPIFSEYLQSRIEEISNKERREIRNKIIKALYFLFVGTFKGYDTSESIFLPLVRMGSGFQNVQLLQGRIEKKDVKLKQTLVYSNFDADENHYILELEFNKVDGTFPISLMLLEYLYKVSRGSISTKLNPSLSHGIDTIKSKIYDKYKFDDPDTIEILVHTNIGPKIISLEIDGTEMFVE